MIGQRRGSSAANGSSLTAASCTWRPWCRGSRRPGSWSGRRRAAEGDPDLRVLPYATRIRDRPRIEHHLELGRNTMTLIRTGSTLLGVLAITGLVWSATAQDKKA